MSELDNYRTQDNLEARISLYDYKYPQYDLDGIVSNAIDFNARTIVDVGSGTGRYTRRLRKEHPHAEVIGIDLSPGMVDDLDEPTMVANVENLPFPDGYADVALAMHMLYHADDVDAALDELVRVTRSDGILFMSTMAADNFVEYEDLFLRAQCDVLDDDRRTFRDDVMERFSLDIGVSKARERFWSVTVRHLQGRIVLSAPEPLFDYYRSGRSFHSTLSDDEFDSVMDRIEALLKRHFETHETFTVTSHPGIIECRNPR
ncbi:class I SAM-dependent methyltransferase [Haloglycomyces albus]|uniref:class I SAM-dependent methyltransferase n=1 Tax=Haloglycomyces albus TaxID=526067 RepID=UPI00046D8C89|nr:class I SAM-dependent methyltransferase [Haloglycomyces albus]